MLKDIVIYDCIKGGGGGGNYKESKMIQKRKREVTFYWMPSLPHPQAGYVQDIPYFCRPQMCPVEVQELNQTIPKSLRFK